MMVEAGASGLQPDLVQEVVAEEDVVRYCWLCPVGNCCLC